MRGVACVFLALSLVLGGMAIPAGATGRHHRHHKHYVRHDHRHGHFVSGFVTGAGSALVVRALYTPRVVYTAPVAYESVSHRAPVCWNSWVSGGWQLRTQQHNGFTSYYHVWVGGHWQRHCR